MNGNLETNNINIQMSNRAVLHGVTKGSSNKPSKGPENRILGRQDENSEMKPKKSADENSVVDDQEHVETPGGPGHHHGGGAPSSNKYPGMWWSRVEKDERFYSKVDKENATREEK